MGFGEKILNLVSILKQFLRERIIIDLDKVDHSKPKIYEAIGVDRFIFDAYADYIISKYTPKTLAEALRLDKDEIVKALEESWNSNEKVSEIIASWWKKRGRKKITLEEWIGTYLIIDLFEKLKRPIPLILMRPKRRDFSYIA